MRLWLALASVLLALASCDAAKESETSKSSSDRPSSFGTAEVTPAAVKSGERFTVAPDGEIEPVCLNVAVVLREDGGGQLARVGLLTPDGSWQPYGGTPEPTVAVCQPAPSSDAETYIFPSEMAGGDYVICLSWEPEQAACGQVSGS